MSDDPMTIEAQIHRLRTGDLAARIEAAAALTTAGSAAVPALIAVLQDPSADNDTRWRAAVILGDIGDRAGVPPLITAIHDPSWEIQHSAVWALGRIQTPESFAALRAVVEHLHTEEQVPYVAALALIAVDRGRAEPVLISARQHADDAVRRIAYAALATLKYTD
ncbi:MAG: HEAT repeat domain-containing protein [Chloroflexi bacterium]|nr:HEAT repeat domain-containing protein [Chloroflexota bacterium]